MSKTTAAQKQKDYELVIKQLRALSEGESNTIANLANASALLNQFLNEVNWVGFYLMEDGELIIRPFPGAAGLCSHSTWKRRMRYSSSKIKDRANRRCSCIPWPHCM